MFPPRPFDEHIKQAGMLTHHKMPAVGFIIRGIVRDQNVIGPLNVVPGYPSILPHELNGVGQDKKCALLAVLLNDGIGSAFSQAVSVVMIGDGFLHILGAGRIAAEGIPIRPHFLILHGVSYWLIIHRRFPNGDRFDLLPRLLHEQIQLVRMAADLP